MQRVRIGLTGLAFVFLVVLLAAVFTNRPVEEPPITVNSIEQQRTGGPMTPGSEAAESDPAEPLAELGVAPGKAETNSAVPAEMPPGAQPDPR